jgi:hypothetical protein
VSRRAEYGYARLAGYLGSESGDEPARCRIDYLCGPVLEELQCGRASGSCHIGVQAPNARSGDEGPLRDSFAQALDRHRRGNKAKLEYKQLVSKPRRRTSPSTTGKSDVVNGDGIRAERLRFIADREVYFYL